MYFFINVPNSWAFGKDLIFFLLGFGFHMLHQEANLLATSGRMSPVFKALQKTPTFWNKLHCSIIFQGFNKKVIKINFSVSLLKCLKANTKSVSTQTLQVYFKKV